MRILKGILVVIIGIIALVLIIALFVKKEYVVEREVTINKPRQEVFDYIKMIRNQDHYNKWVRMDPNVRKSYEGTDGTVGFVYKWDGNSEVGKGEQKVTNITEGERVDLAIHFIKPFEGDAAVYMVTTAPATNLTNVNWGMAGRTPYPMNFMNLFINDVLGRDLQTSLNDLKSTLERKQ